MKAATADARRATRYDTPMTRTQPPTPAPTGETPPMAERRPVIHERFGRRWSDPYAWLRDDNWQAVMADPKVLRADIRAHLDAENAHTQARLDAPTANLREDLFREMRGRIKEDDHSVPVIDGPYAYLTRYREGGEYPILARKPAERAYDPDAPETVLLDGDALGAGKAYFSFGEVEHSPDHRLIAYAVDEQGSEYYTIRFRDTATGEDLPDTIERTYGDFVWAADSRTLYWVERDDNSRPSAVHAYTLGSRSGSREIYREPDPGFFVGVDRTQSDRFILIGSGNHTTSEVRVFEADASDPQPRLIAAREAGVEYDVEHWGDRFVITTNADGALDFKIVTAPLDTPGRAHWTDLVPHRPGVLILDTVALKGHLVRLERFEGLPRLVVRRADDGAEHTLAFDEAAYTLGMSAGYAYDTTLLRIDYASPAQPDQVFDYDLETRERTLRKTREVPSGHEPSAYEVERILAPAPDGETVPITLLRRADAPRDGTAPLLLYGYGAYGITLPAAFRTARLSLVDRGVTFAIAHVRGSKAKGYRWYLDGKLEKKTNTFKDFIAAADHLIAEGYTARGRIVAEGGSAGGMLVGAVANLAPDRFAGILAQVPFVDVLNTMSDATLPLTPPEWPEWGNPLEDGEAFERILAYAPYENVSDRPYPPILATGGLSDPRVTYWEPAKWIARLRHDAPGGGPYLLHINMEAGHGGASGRFEGLKETARDFAFVLACLGLADGVELGRT